jgi:hypothetical protein
MKEFADVVIVALFLGVGILGTLASFAIGIAIYGMVRGHQSVLVSFIVAMIVGILSAGGLWLVLGPWLLLRWYRERGSAEPSLS